MATALGVTAANALIRFDTAAPATILSSSPITGLVAGDTVEGIDFRPATGQLFALGGGGRLYTIDPNTAVATQVGADGAFSLTGAEFGFDFNPVPDRIRVTSDAEQDLRLNPNDGSLTATDGALAYAAGDPNNGAAPTVVASAYINSVAGATATTLYDIDSGLDILVIQNPPNSGALNTVGSLGVDVQDVAGFDIQALAGGGNAAFAALTTDGAGSGLYTIDLATGAATLVGPIGAGATLVRGLAIVPEVVPPATLLGLDAANNLVRFNANTPGTIIGTTPITGLADGETIVGIDFRPAGTNPPGAIGPGLYGLGSGSRLYRIDPATGAATQVGGDGAFSLAGDAFGFDFNPIPDRIRVVSDAEQDLRLNPNDGSLTATDGTIAYATGDPGEGVTPNLVGSAYINSFPGTGATTLFGIDVARDVLVTQNPPNAGTLNTVGPLGVALPDGDGPPNPFVGFDTRPLPGLANQAFAALSTDGTSSGLYTIDLATGAATLVGPIGGGTILLQGLAVVPAGAFRFSAPTYSVGEDGPTATVTVNRIGGGEGVVTVRLTTTDGTATAPADYAAFDQVLIFGPGVTSRTVQIPITDDTFIEAAETINLALADPTGGAVLAGTQTTAVLTIVDDEVLQAASAVGLTDSNALVFFSTAAPGTITATVPITGLVGGDTVVGIDFRPATGQLYGLGARGRLYTINPATGVATQVGTDGAFSLVGGAFGFDFNPIPDRIRVVSDAEQDLRLNPNDGSLTATDGTIAYAAGDPNAGVTPDLVASAYINSFAGTTTTTLFGLDTLTDSLVIQNPPNAGTLNTVGPLGLDVNDALRGFVGFDVRTQPDGGNAAFATLPVGPTGATLYAIDLTTGTATPLGAIGGGLTLLRGLAILPPVVLNPSAPALDEGDTLTLGVSFTPTDPTQGHTVRIDWGDGTPETVRTLDPGTTSVAGIAHTYADNSPAGGPPFTVRVTVVAPGGTVGTASQPIAVANVAPSLTIGGASSTQPGIATYTLNLAASDPGADTIASWTIVWGDGTTDTVPGSATTATHVYARCDTFTISATATDEDGTFAAGNTVTVVASLPTRNQCFVAQVYADVLGRPVDGTGLSFWTSELDRGVTRADVVLRIEQTAEARMVQVQEYYQRYLGRAADGVGLADFTAALLAGTLRSEDVIAAIVGSPEYFANAGGTNDAFLEQAYLDLLGRPLDGVGRAGWGAALAGGMTRAQVARAILQSEEGRRFAVDGFYQRYLGRAADGVGLSAFAEQLRLGATYEQVIAQLVGSQEYLDRFVPA